jgi:hypothetical protein
VIKCFFVDIANISSEIPRSSFEESNLEQLADLILQTDGLLRPLILKETGVEKYTVVEGHREYYASVQAKKKNRNKAEMVNAFIIPNQIQSAVIEQLNLLKSALSPTPISGPSLVSIEQLLPTLLAAISQQIQPIVNQLAEHQKILDVIKSTNPNISPIPPSLKTEKEATPPPQPAPIPVDIVNPPPVEIEKIEPIQTFKAIDNSDEIAAVSKLSDAPPIILDALTLINTLSQEELHVRMERSGISKAITKLVPNLINTRNIQPNQKFDTWETIIAAKIAGLASGRIKQITEKLK